MALTKYSEGSLRELWTIAFPLMLSSLSVQSMIFTDRWLLAHYSTEAHNAAVTATTLGWALIYGWVVLANIAEVFVAQYNGARLYRQLAEPVWQMIWLSLVSIIFFLPLSLWGGAWLYGSGSGGDLEKDYFDQMLLFGPFYPLGAAFCAFFIGQGKTRLVTIVVILGSLLNILLDLVLIFGVEGLVPAMGVKGAAIATSAAAVIQVIVFGMVFFNKRNRENYGTFRYHLKFTILWECLKVGLPSAIFICCDILAFAIYYRMMKDLGQEYITIAGICQSMVILFYFFAEGINKATATIVGNIIGAGRSSQVSKVLVSGLKLNLIFFAFMFVLLGLGSPLIIDQFLPQADPEFIASIQGTLRTSLLLMSFYMFFEGIRLQLAGILTAAGDTVFLFAAGTLSVWVLMVLPVYAIVVRGKLPIEMANVICIAYGLIASLIYFWRIFEGKWRSIVISSELKGYQ